MTKYSTPSIEVVTFNSSDAPRIGMQWWAVVEGTADVYAAGAWFAVPNYTPVDLPDMASRYIDMTTSGSTCSYVRWRNCGQENIPGALSWEPGVYPVADDGASC